MTYCDTPNRAGPHDRMARPRHASAGRVAITCLLLAGIGLVASGCTGFRKAIGEEKSSPDEFEVVVRPPLSLPPNFFASSSQLTENTPTASASAAPSDSPIDARSVAAAALGATEGRAADNYAQIFDFSAVPDNIRQIVDEETYGIRFERRIPLQILFGGLPDIGPVLDKFAEDQRLRNTLREGRSATEGGTPATDLLDEAPVTIGN
ncbi:MAG: DUF3035 domain-containing protein [Pseudomonadota bacterium]|nr:DUF3035 domain-containing protein [Pseudomonadota bacterium]